MPPIALHQAVFDLGAGAELLISCALGRGRPVLPYWTTTQLVSAEEELDIGVVASGGIFPMCWRESGALFESFQLREDTEYDVDVTVPLDLAEAERRSATSSSWPFDSRLASAFRRSPVRRWKQVVHAGQTKTVVTGQLTLRSFAGVLEFSTEFSKPLRAEVVCRKLSYFDDFKGLLEGLAEHLAEILFKFESPVFVEYESTSRIAENDAAQLFMMRYLMSDARLPSAIAEILHDPHEVLATHIDDIPIEEIVDVDAEQIIDGMDFSQVGSGGPLARFFRGSTPRFLPNRLESRTVDTPENRYVKYFLIRCRDISEVLQLKMSRRKRFVAAREARTWADRLDGFLHSPFWREVGVFGVIPMNSQVLLRRRGYKELIQADVLLRSSLSLRWPTGTTDEGAIAAELQSIDQLYEFWCFLTLRSILSEMCTTVVGGRFVRVSRDELTVELKRGATSECRFEFASSDGRSLQVSLFYNRIFRRSTSSGSEWSGSYSAAFTPDFSIAVRDSASPGRVAHWLHFDAKYRLDFQALEQPGDDVDTEGAGLVTPVAGDSYYDAEIVRMSKRESLFKMHTYRDGILRTRGAYVLFPGDGVGGQSSGPTPSLFVRFPDGGVAPQDIRIPSVGAFDLTPANVTSQQASIGDFLRSVFDTVLAGGKYVEETAFFNDGAPPDTEAVGDSGRVA